MPRWLRPRNLATPDAYTEAELAISYAQQAGIACEIVRSKLYGQVATSP